MSTGNCCCEPGSQVGLDREFEQATVVRPGLFNWVTVILLTGWVGIVTAALNFAGPENVTAMPTMEAFLRSLLS